MMGCHVRKPEDLWTWFILKHDIPRFKSPMWVKALLYALVFFLYVWRIQKITMSEEDHDETEYLNEMRWWRFGR